MGKPFEPQKPFLSKVGTKWTIGLSLLGLATLGGTIFYGLQLINSQSSQSEPEEEITPVVEGVTALGRLEPQGEVIDISASTSVSGARIAELKVEEGDKVRENQIIAILDDRDRLLAAVEKAKKDVKVAQANLEIVKAGAQTGEINAQAATVRRLQAQLQGEITNQEATINRLEANLRLARKEYERYLSLARDGAISASDLDQRRLELDNARELLNEAIANQNLKIAPLEQQIREAQANLDRIKEIRPVDVQQAQAEVERAIAILKQAEEDLKLVYVRTPIRGQIIQVNARPGEVISSLGDGQNSGIVKLGQTEKMVAVAEVKESDISLVKLGQRAVVTSLNGSFPGEVRGSVAQVGLQIAKQDVLDTDPAADTDARVIEVDIRLDQEDSEKVANLTNAKVVIKILL